MAYIEIDIDIDEYIDQVDTDTLVNELKYRAERDSKQIRSFFTDRMDSGTIKEDICDLLGLNYLASKEDIVIELMEKLR